MRAGRSFPACLAGFLLLYAAYGAQRLTLGVDFTDEGEFVTWPLRTLFGERPFASEVMTLLKPIGLFLWLPFKLHPEITLYEVRLIGWTFHLLAFAVLSTYLFVQSRAAFRSLLIASVPFFVCNIFGVATPSYNNLSSDFLLIALSLAGLAAHPDILRKNLVSVLGGGALFIATLAHPALGLVAAVLLARECGSGGLLKHIVRRQTTPSNRGLLMFLACWVVLLLYLAGSGALADWIQRVPLTRTFAASALADHPLRFFAVLACHPFFYSPLATGFALAAVALLVIARGLGRSDGVAPSLSPAGEIRPFRPLDGWLALLFILSLVCCYIYEPRFLPGCFAQIGLLLIVTVGTRLVAGSLDAAGRFLLWLSGLGAVLCATFTFYFSPERSWLSGVLALPFAFGVGLTALLDSPTARPALNRALVAGSLILAVAGVARDHYGFVFRDASPPALSASFRAPALRQLRSTPERVQAVDELYDYLQPRVARGQRLLVFDECAMLYFVFHAMPAYAWAGAKRYNLSETTLVRLDQEFRSKALPTYAVRTLIDVSNPIWRDAPRTRYDDYPLNETLLAHYQLERTIFPFEVWRLTELPPH